MAKTIRKSQPKCGHGKPFQNGEHMTMRTVAGLASFSEWTPCDKPTTEWLNKHATKSVSSLLRF